MMTKFSEHVTYYRGTGTTVKAKRILVGLRNRQDVACAFNLHHPHINTSTLQHFPHTFAVFHPPLLNSHRVNKPTDVSEMNTPQNTPECPQSSDRAR